MRLIGLICAACLMFVGVSESLAQANGFQTEVYQVHYGTVGTTDLTGYITYRIAVTMQSPDDIISAVYGVDPTVCDDIPEGEEIFLQFSGDVYQNPSAGPFLQDVSCGFIDFIPEMEYDSYLTLDRFCPDPPGPFFVATLCGDFQDWDTNGGDLLIDDGAYFTTFPGVGPAGDDGLVYIAQITTTGSITGCVGISTFVGGDQNTQDTSQVCFEIENPCLANPLDPQVNIIDDIDCFGELATVQIGDGTANGAIEYTMFIDGVPQPIQNTNEFIQLQANTEYLVAVEDEIGCRDTSEVFTFSEPPELIINSELTTDVLCFGDETGVITNASQGGTGDPTFYLNDDLANGVLDGETFDALGCGTYEVMVEDENGCRDSLQISVSCPDQLVFEPEVTNSTCNAFDDGSIIGTLNGGTGVSTATWTSSVDATFNVILNGPTPLAIGINNLEPAVYTVSIEDQNGCTLTADYEITEPNPVLTTVETTDVSCNGIADGSIDVSAEGGTPDYDFTNAQIDGTPATFDGLLAGVYVVTTEDEQGCTVMDTVEIFQPAAVTFDSVLVQDVSCFGLCDGLITYVNLGGGEGNVVLNSVPVLNNNIDNNGFIEACEGDYTILALDEGNNCTYSLGTESIIEPPALELTVTAVDIACFGDSSGSITVDCAGGTGEIELMINDSLWDCGLALDSLGPGDYEITLIDETQCTNGETVTLTEPSELLLTITGTEDLDCGGDSNGAVFFDFEGGTPADTGDAYDFLLNGAQQSLVDLIQLEAGDYELCVQDDNLCLACDSFAILEPDPITFLFNVTNTTCTGMSDGTLNVFAGGGTGPVTISFDPPNLDTNNLPEGEYVVYAVDSVGCAAQDTALVEANIITDLAVEIFTTPLTCWNTGDGTATVAVTGGTPPFQIQWGDPDLQVTTTAVGLPEGSYQVIVSDTEGCQVDSVAVIGPNEGCFFIATAATPNDDGVNDEWIVGGLEYFPNATVQVYNRWGQLLYESRGTYVPWDCEFNGRKVAVGDYYYIIDYDDNADPITGTVTIRY